VTQRKTETRRTPLTHCDSVNECQQCSRKGKWQCLLQLTVDQWKTEHQRAVAVQQKQYSSSIKTPVVWSLQTRKSQHSKECKDQCRHCFCDSWHWPLTPSRTHRGTFLRQVWRS